MIKLPYGKSDYQRIIEDGFYYVDKTMYIEKLERVADTVTYLRPRRFGKTLFTSMLYYYYDVLSKSEFEKLFKGTYVYEHPTENKNSYYILKFDFSGITTNNSFNNAVKELENTFNKRVVAGVTEFIQKYNLDISIDNNQSANDYICKFLSQFSMLNLERGIYIIIDEYDNFTNAILKGNADAFSEVTGQDGFLKAFYSEIKKRTADSIVERVFITGVCSITLDSMTSGFNIATDLTNDFRFNSMIGLTHSEVKALVNKIESNPNKQKEIYNLLVEYYDGYLFNINLSDEDKTFNTTSVMKFLSYYSETKMYLDDLIDSNTLSSYESISNILTIKNNTDYQDILLDILDDNKISGKIITKFDLASDFTRDHIVTLLYYFGYLSICGSNPFGTTFKMPNKVISTYYGECFKSMLKKEVNLDNKKLLECLEEVVYQGSITKITNYISELLKLSENRIFTKFSEKYIQIMYYSLLNLNNNTYDIYNEYLMSGGYADIYVRSNIPECVNDILIELKYLKKEEYSEELLNTKYNEALTQIDRYIQDKRIDTSKLRKYIVVFVKDEVKLLKEV